MCPTARLLANQRQTNGKPSCLSSWDQTEGSSYDVVLHANALPHVNPLPDPATQRQSKVYITSLLPLLKPLLLSSSPSTTQTINPTITNTFHTNHTNSTTTSIIMDTIKNAGNYVSDKVQSATSGASKEANKDVAKDNNAGVGTR